MQSRRQLFSFFAATLCMASAMSVHDSIFNNFLSESFHISAGARGWLELPREMPGFLVFFMAGLLAALPMTSVGLVATLVFAAGMVGLALFGGGFGLMVTMMVLASAGLHLLQPVGLSVALSLSDDHSRGKRMGQVGAVETLGVVLGTGVVWLTFSKSNPQYRTGFVLAAALACVAALAYGRMRIDGLRKPRARLVVHRKYRLYYLLELFFGARKQIFITFGPWVLIKVYGVPATSIARLLMTAALIGIVFKPLAGLAMDRFGERAIMVADGLCLVFVCLGYGYALPLTGSPQKALTLASACFIADNLLFALGACRAIYLSRIADSPQNLASSLAMGVSINHAISMTVPALAGLAWTALGYERVFAGAALLAAATAALGLLVPGKRHADLARAQGPLALAEAPVGPEA